MRLLNKYTKEFEWFAEAPPNAYYILSHRWIGDETTMQSFALTRHLPRDQMSPGDGKVHRFCEFMQREDRPLKHVWIDTCCIDKTSSSELQEAINSMYKWYEQAAECVVYLDDVDDLVEGPRSLARSDWFTRGWCLQELLSPLQQQFLDSRWNSLGHRGTLSPLLEEITGIRRECFGNSGVVRSASVAERMSWMSRRSTSRGEDMAYAMLGIFDINMTMLYGEGGEKAFLRLQKKILHSTNDETIFVWRARPELWLAGVSGLLAPHPDCFQQDVAQALTTDSWFDRAPYHMTNKGLQIELFADPGDRFAEIIALTLNCQYRGERVQIELAKCSADDNENIWRRSDCNEITTVRDEQIRRPLTGKQIYLERRREQEDKAFGVEMMNELTEPFLPWERYHIYVLHQSRLSRISAEGCAVS